MHRVSLAVLFTLLPASALAQAPASTTGTAPAPAAPPASAPAAPNASAPAAPGAAPSPPPPGAPAAAPSAAPPAPAAGPPGEQYYVEPPGEPLREPRRPPRERMRLTPPAGVYEPPIPGGVYEPPPPPEPRHLAPRTSLWAGVRLGWFFPFGTLWSRAAVRGEGNAQYLVYEGVPWSDFASSGPMFELNAGARVSRNYNVFFLWERAELDGGDGSSLVLNGEAPESADTDYWAIGLRANSDADEVGFITEIALGYRRARSTWADGTEVQFTAAPLEARLGLGAEIRLNRFLTLSPLATIGVGAFGDVEVVSPDGRRGDLTAPDDEGDGHAWVTLGLGVHFDVLRSEK